MEKYFNINREGNSIRCKLYYRDLKAVRRVVVCGHGFTGNKDNKATERIADFVLKKHKDAAFLIYDAPCHGDDVKKKLQLNDCMTYLRLVTEYAKTTFKTDGLYGYANSFGGYQFLKYIAENGSPFVKLVLRCPAVEMYKVLSDSIMETADLKALKNGKPVLAGFERKIKINKDFLDSLKASDITAYDYAKYADDILIMHGTKDEVVDFDSVRAFAEKNAIRFVPIENADHRFKDPKAMDAAIREITEFYRW